MKSYAWILLLFWGGLTANLSAAFAPTQEDPNARNTPELIRQPILYVARLQYLPDHHNTATLFQTGEINHGSFRGGSALRVADFAQKDEAGNPRITTLLECPDGVIRDPEVHPDGQKILFSMRKNKDDDYHLYELNADGTGLRQITTGSGLSDIDPIYLPDGRILFSSTREPKFCMCNRHVMGNLFTIRADGTGMDQIGHSTLFEGHPSLLSDGRVIYERWEYVDRNFGDAQGLWTTNPDGTRHLLFWGNNTASPGGVLDAREIPGSKNVVCTFSSCHDRPWGAIAIVDRTRGVDGKAAVIFTLPPDAMDRVDVGNYDQFLSVTPKYEDPYPLSDQYFLVSRDLGNERMGLVLFDLKGHETVLFADSHPDWGVFDAMPLAPLPPERRAPVTESEREASESNLRPATGTLYVTNVYESQEMESVAPGEVQFLRIVEAPEKRYWTRNFWTTAGEQAPAMNWQDFGNKRILGVVPVEADGSAHFEVPADTFVFFQLLDAQGRMVHSMRSGTIARSGERQGCSGCHENRLNSVPYTGSVQAFQRPASIPRLATWLGEKPEDFSFMKYVQPIFDRHCVQCHDFDGPGAKSVVLAADRNLCFNTAYTSLYQNGKLIVPGAGPTKTMPAKSWGSTVSPLAKIVLSGHGDERDTKFSLTATEKDTIITWIDLNAPYYPTYASNYRNMIYGRSPLTDEELQRLAEWTGTPLPSLAQQFGETRLNIAAVVFDRPEKSPCLAHLDPHSDAYREALALIRIGTERLRQHPRADMPDFQMLDENDLRQEAKYQRYLQNFPQ